MWQYIEAMTLVRLLVSYILNILTYQRYSIPAIEPITINTAGVADFLSNIQPLKASGPDNIPAFLLKEIAFQIAPPSSSSGFSGFIKSVQSTNKLESSPCGPCD